MLYVRRLALGGFPEWGIMESVSDYWACFRVNRVPPRLTPANPSGTHYHLHLVSPLQDEEQIGL